MRVAIIEDDEMIVDVLQTVLQRHGFTVSAVCNAFAARKLLPFGEIDLFVCDVHLPDGSGVALVQEVLQGNPEGKLILMSGALSVVDVEGLTMQNGQEIPVLQKPFLLSQFLEEVFRLCGRPEDAEAENRQVS